MKKKLFQRIIRTFVPLICIAIIFLVIYFIQINNQIVLQENEHSTQYCRVNLDKSKWDICDYMDENIPTDQELIFSFEETAICTQKVRLETSENQYILYIGEKPPAQNLQIIFNILDFLPVILFVIMTICLHGIYFIFKNKGVTTTATIEHIELEQYWSRKYGEYQTRCKYTYSYRDKEYNLYKKHNSILFDPCDNYKEGEQFQIVYLEFIPKIEISNAKLEIFNFGRWMMLFFTIVMSLIFNSISF
jgi:hypothetical protein